MIYPNGLAQMRPSQTIKHERALTRFRKRGRSSASSLALMFTSLRPCVSCLRLSPASLGHIPFFIPPSLTTLFFNHILSSYDPYPLYIHTKTLLSSLLASCYLPQPFSPVRRQTRSTILAYFTRPLCCGRAVTLLLAQTLAIRA